MNSSTLNWKQASGHQILAAAGKKILRPGGRAATAQLFEWAGFEPDETVLELASSFGDSAIALAQQYGVQVVGVEKNPESVARARANIAKAGLSDRIQIIEGDIFHLEAISEQFDYVLAEAILTMQSLPGKAKILSAICDRLKPGGKLLSHELLARQREEEIHQALAQAIRVNSTPLSQANWIAACEGAGLQVRQVKTGEMALLNLRQMLADEGVLATVQFLWNVLRRSPIRQRVFAMRQVFQHYRQDLGHIIFLAQRP